MWATESETRQAIIDRYRQVSKYADATGFAADTSDRPQHDTAFWDDRYAKIEWAARAPRST